MFKDLKELDDYLEKERAFLNVELGKKEVLEDKIEKTEKNIEKLKEDINILDKVNMLFKRSSEFARNQSKKQIESLVTKCLQYVFQEEISFEIEIKELRGRPSAKFYVTNIIDGKEIKLEPEESKGGGVVDIVSLALRIAFLETHKPKILGPLILDEPAKHVSDEYIYNVSNFLKESSELFNRQIIMITHNNYLASIGDISYKITQLNGESNVEIMES